MLEVSVRMLFFYGVSKQKPSWHVTYLIEALENIVRIFMNNMHTKNYLCVWQV